MSRNFWGADKDIMTDFENQVQAYFSHEDDYDVESTLEMVTLKLHNSKYLIQTTPEQNGRYR